MKFTTWLEIPVAVEFDYSPPQQQTQTDPSFPAEVGITSVVFAGVELLEKLDTKQREAIQDECWVEVCERLEFPDEN